MEPTTEFVAIQGISLPAAVVADQATFIEATRNGVSGEVLRQAVEALGHRDLFVRLLETTTGNLSRFYRRKALNAYHSEGILDTLRVFSKAIRVFGDSDIAVAARETADGIARSQCCRAWRSGALCGCKSITYGNPAPDLNRYAGPDL